MGVIYTRTSDGRTLRTPPTEEERVLLLARFYAPHHAALASAVARACAARGSCLIIDPHSFPSRPLPYEFDQRHDRPDICIGTDPHHTPASLRDFAVSVFEEAGLRVAVDEPFSGALVPSVFYRCDARVESVMVEVNRGLYMNEDTGERAAHFFAFERRFRSLIARLARVQGADEEPVV